MTKERITELRDTLAALESWQSINEWVEKANAALSGLVECLDEIERLEAVNAVQGGEWCAQNRAEGRGGCGACAWCCQQLRDELERLQAGLNRNRDRFERHADWAVAEVCVGDLIGLNTSERFKHVNKEKEKP